MSILPPVLLPHHLSFARCPLTVLMNLPVSVPLDRLNPLSLDQLVIGLFLSSPPCLLPQVPVRPAAGGAAGRVPLLAEQGLAVCLLCGRRSDFGWNSECLKFQLSWFRQLALRLKDLKCGCRDLFLFAFSEILRALRLL